MSAVVGFFSQLGAGIRGALSLLFVIPFRVQFILLWVIALLFLLFNAGAFYGEDAGRQTTILLMYTVALAFVFANTRQRNPLLTITAGEFIITFALWAAVGALLFKFIEPLNPERAVLNSASIATLVIQALVVAVGEELLFRVAIPSLIPAPAMVAQVFSAIVFGLLHLSAYGGDFSSMLFATILGLFFGAIVVLYRDQGLIIVSALHFVWNAYTLGFL